MTAGFWLAVGVVPIATIWSESDLRWIGFITFWGWVLILWIVTWLISGLSFKDWLSCICFSGVRKIARWMTKMSKELGDTASY